MSMGNNCPEMELIDRYDRDGRDGAIEILHAENARLREQVRVLREALTDVWRLKDLGDMNTDVVAALAATAPEPETAK